MAIGKDFLLPEEIKLAERIVCQNHKAFAWTDSERGSFDPQYFSPIEIPHISHTAWVYRQGPIPRGILDQVNKVTEEKWRSGVYEPSSSSYNSRWFCVYKKDGKSLRLVHSLEPLNAVIIKNAATPPYTDVVAEDFAGRSVCTTRDLYVSVDQRQLHPNSRDMMTLNTPLGAFHLMVLPMGWTNSPAVLQGDITHILCVPRSRTEPSLSPTTSLSKVLSPAMNFPTVATKLFRPTLVPVASFGSTSKLSIESRSVWRLMALPSAERKPLSPSLRQKFLGISVPTKEGLLMLLECKPFKTGRSLQTSPKFVPF